MPACCWKKYYKWPDSYARFIEYVWSRYQANNTVLSPIHLDIISETVGPDEFMKAIQHGDGKVRAAAVRDAALRQRQPFHAGELGRRLLGDAAPDRQHARALQLLVPHRDLQAGAAPRPALNGEPYYSGYNDARSQGGGRGYQYGAPGGTEKDDQYVRSAMYGSFLSGGFGGHVYGAEGIWGADIEDAAPIKMWDAFQWNSAAQMKYLRDFALSIGKRYQELEPDADLVSPNQDSRDSRGYEGWAYGARTPDKNIFLAYFEKGCPRSQVRGARLNATYRAQWFDPRNGSWRDAGAGTVRSSAIGIITLPAFPDDNDWGLRLTYEGQAPQGGRGGRGGSR